MGDLIPWWKMGFWKPWVTLKTPFLPLLNQFTEPCEGCPTAIYSLSIGMYSTVNYSMPIYALFYNPYIIIYIYVSADYPV